MIDQALVKESRPYEDIVMVWGMFSKVAKRTEQLKKWNYKCVNVAMGSGGVGQVKEVNGKIRVQYSFGTGKWNYAMAVEIEKEKFYSSKSLK
jgi:hypothetical protein